MLRRCVAGMPVLRNRGNGGVVVVVVLGVELELVGGCGSHCEGDCSVGMFERAMREVQAIGVVEYVSSRCGVERADVMTALLVLA